jgi:hypothetical protein
MKETAISSRAAARIRNQQLDDQVLAFMRDTTELLVTTSRVWRGLGFATPHHFEGESYPRWLCLTCDITASLKRLEKKDLVKSIRYPGTKAIHWHRLDY